MFACIVNPGPCFIQLDAAGFQTERSQDSLGWPERKVLDGPAAVLVQVHQRPEVLPLPHGDH